MFIAMLSVVLLRARRPYASGIWSTRPQTPSFSSWPPASLAESPRLRALYNICERAFNDREGGQAKNVFVVVKRPIHAILVQLALEKHYPADGVLRITPALIHAGLDNIKAASYCVHFGLHPSSGTELQATHRVERQGQPFPVRIFHLRDKSKGSIDAMIQGIREKGDRLTAKDSAGPGRADRPCRLPRLVIRVLVSSRNGAEIEEYLDQHV